jgi:hypothetical protein
MKSKKPKNKKCNQSGQKERRNGQEKEKEYFVGSKTLCALLL